MRKDVQRIIARRAVARPWMRGGRAAREDAGLSLAEREAVNPH